MRHKRNEKGAALLMVMITIMFLSVLGTALMSMTLVNTNMKYVDRNFKNSHYYAESGIEEAYTVVAVQVQNSISKAQEETNAYLEKLTLEAAALIAEIKEDYLMIDTTVQNKELWNLNLSEMEQIVIIPSSDAQSKKYEALCEILNEENRITLKTLYEAFLDKSLSIKGDVLQQQVDNKYKEAFIKDWTAKLKASDDNYIKTAIEGYDYQFKEGVSKVTASITDTMSLEDISQESHETTITVKSSYAYKGTDQCIEAEIIVGAPFEYPIQIQEAVTIDNPIWNNALVTQGNLIVNGQAAIEGNVYAYGKNLDEKIQDKMTNTGGIVVQENGSLSIANGNVISKNYIQTKGKASSLNIGNANIFCNSLVIQEGAESSTINVDKSYLYTEDDIEHNGTKSTLSITGRYIGFSSGLTSDEKSDRSSAIIINSPDIGVGSTLSINTAQDKFPAIHQAGATAEYANNDVTISNDLFSASSNKGILIPGTSWIVGSDELARYQTGESVSIKNNYLVYSYLFPYTGTDSEGNDISKFHEDNLNRTEIDGLGIPLISGYKNEITDTEETEKDKAETEQEEKLTYKDKADYFNLFYSQQYQDKNGEQIYPFFNGGKGVDIPLEYFWYTIGSQLGGSADEMAVGSRTRASYQADKIIEQVGLDYTYYLNYLIPRSITQQSSGVVKETSSNEAENVIERYIDMKALENYSTMDSSDTVFKVYKGSSNYVISQNDIGANKYGIIICDGNLTINGPFEFTGAIIATGDLIINGEDVVIKNINENKSGGDNSDLTVLKLAQAVNANTKMRNLFKGNKEYKTQVKIEASSGDAMAYKYSDLIQLTNWRRASEVTEGE